MMTPIVFIIILFLTLYHIHSVRKQKQQELQRQQNKEYKMMMWQIIETYSYGNQEEWNTTEKIVYGSDDYLDCKNKLDNEFHDKENESLFENHWTKRYTIIMKEQHKD